MNLKKLTKINLLKIFRLDRYTKQMIYVMVVAVFLVINLLISSFPLRYDASYGQAYTLSTSTKNLIKHLDDIVNIKFFASSDIPTRFIPLKTDVVDLLNEYKSQGYGKIIIKILDPKTDSNAQNQAKNDGVPELNFSQLEQDKYAVTTSYFGIVISYAGKNEIIPQVTDIGSLEYNLTASIYKLVKKGLTNIGVIGETESANPQQDNLATLKNFLGQQYNIQYLDLASKSIDPSNKALLVFDTDSKTYSAEEIKTLEDYFAKGGKAIFFVDGVWISGNFTTSQASNNLTGLLDGYGIKVDNNLILSMSASLVNFGGGQVSLLVPYPFWLKTNSFNSKYSYFSNLSQLVYPWTSSLTLAKKPDVISDYLVKTSNRSWSLTNNPQAGGIDLNPQNIAQPGQGDLKEFFIGAQAVKKNGSEIVIMPSSRFVQENFLGQSTDNLSFILNVLNNLASDGALAGIRSRDVSLYPLPNLPQNEQDALRYLNILLLPGIFAAFGAYKLLKRR